MTAIQTQWKKEQGKIVVARSQDVEPYIKANKIVRNAFSRTLNAPMRYVAEIPFVVIEQWMKEGVNIFNRNDNKEVQRRLNSNEFQDLRTSTGKMAMK